MPINAGRTGKNLEAIQEVAPGKPVFTPQTVKHMRSSIAHGLGRTIPHAIEVIEGTRKWTPVQATVFRTLLNKVLPDLEAKAVQHDIRDKSLNELSREELERIIAEG